MDTRGKKPNTNQEIHAVSINIESNISEEVVSEDRSIYLKLWVLKMIMAIYGVITLPIYFLIQKPWKVWQAKRDIQAKYVREGDLFSPVQRVVKQFNISMDGATTMDELFRMAVTKHGPKTCLGVREVLAEEEKYDKTGKNIKKQQLGEYRWFSYEDTSKSVDALSKGLLALGLQPKQTIVIYAETRKEWFLVMQACFRINVVVATLYATLREDGIISGINETEVSTVVTSQGLLLKLKDIAVKIPAVNKIIYMENFNQVNINGFPTSISLFKLSEIERMGTNVISGTTCQPPSPNDIAVIMYTSGSTGAPKGVLITHKNILASLLGIKEGVHWKTNDVYIAYLPVAHIYEMVVELYSFHCGILIGYSSPFTLMDNSPGLMTGCKSDMSALQPMILCTVPLILDKIKKGVTAAVENKGAFTREFFKYAIEYKTFWRERGFNTTILNRIVFQKLQQLLGGRVTDIISASAYLSMDTHIFIRSCFDAHLRQGYGTTESTAMGAASKDFTIGRIGAPYMTCYIKLINWDEGGYKATDTPHPRGELVLGGDCVTLGYFKNEKLTEESFTEEDGMRWFYTGDIGEFFPDGTFKIIDRKKNLHKLPHGEYVSLSKVESEMKTSPLVDNICIIGNKDCDYLIALVVPNEDQLKKLATMLNKEDLVLQKLCEDCALTKSVTDILQNHGKKSKLLSREIPQKIKLCFEEWTPESGLVTAALKIKRKALEKFYEAAIHEMYNTSMSSN